MSGLLKDFLLQNPSTFTIIITDERVWELHASHLDFIDKDKRKVFLLPASEEAKAWEQARMILSILSQLPIDKKTLVLNFGGGVVSDIGGFVAATYKRGLRLVNVPTTLLAMIDAAIGGKNGLNFDGIKNLIGTVYLPEKVFIEPDFLHTLPDEEWLNGLGELLKYALIGSPELWQHLQSLPKFPSEEFQFSWIDFCRQFKEAMVARDLYDTCERHVLNFGHTIGHALESLAASRGQKLSHGHAVALGCVAAAHLSVQKEGLSAADFERIAHFVKRMFPVFAITSADVPQILRFCQQDKKNHDGTLRFVLLKNIGEAIWHCETSETEIRQALCFMQS